jgi:hypothetical protein
MWTIQKEPHPAKGAARIDKPANNADYSKIVHQKGDSNINEVKQDAKILQFLKRECQQNLTGEATLQAVFTGLLSVHNRHLLELADALSKEGVDAG